MAQLFPRRFGFLFRLGLLAALVLAITAILLWRATMARPAGINDPLQQPVAFSHKHHVGDDGIDCRYCELFDHLLRHSRRTYDRADAVSRDRASRA